MSKPIDPFVEALRSVAAQAAGHAVSTSYEDDEGKQIVIFDIGTAPAGQEADFRKVVSDALSDFCYERNVEPSFIVLEPTAIPVAGTRRGVRLG